MLSRIHSTYSSYVQTTIEYEKKLKEDLEWSLCMQKSVIIRVAIDVEYELSIRNSILNRISKS